MSAATLIPVAGGKGGVGKSLLTAQLGVSLARRGQSVIVVDLDLGGGNLHTYLGKPISALGISHFLHKRPSHLEDCVENTQVGGLRLLAGDGGCPLMANLPSAQKSKLIRHLRALEADFVLLDLSAGSSFTTLDFFAVARRGLLVTTPDPVALTNMLGFLKNLMFRIANRNLPRNDLARRSVLKILKDIQSAELDFVDLLGRIKNVSPDSAAQFRSQWDQFLPRVIFNMGRHPSELDVCAQLDTGLRSRLDKTVEYFGFVFEDPQAREAIRYGHDDLIACNGFQQDIDRLAERIIRRWGSNLPNSADRLYQDCSETFAQRYEEQGLAEVLQS